jgi:hypothetical protein
MTSPIEQLVIASQEQHRRYYELFGTNPVRGDGLRDLATYSRGVGKQARDIRDGVTALNFSTEVAGRFAESTRSDSTPF